VIETSLNNEEEQEKIEIEIDENLDEMITFEQDEITPQGEMPVEAPVTPEAPVEEIPIDAPVEDMGQPEGVEQIAQSLASEIIKLVQTATGEGMGGAPEVVIDDEQEIDAGMPAEQPAPAPAPEQPVQEDELFEVDVDEFGEEKENDEIFEISLEEIEGGEEYFEIDPEDEGDITAMLNAVGDIGTAGEDWKNEMPDLNIPKVGMN